MPREKKKSMVWVLFAIGAALSWGVYGAMLHRGQMQLANPMKALLCVGMAYFLIGALFIILAFKSGGLPAYVMPLVFGGAPLINVLVSMWIHPPKSAINPLLYVGYLMTAGGAGLVLYFKPA